MTVDITRPTDNDTLSAQELALYNLLMDYRAKLGLAAIPLSQGLTVTAGRHAVDTYENIWQTGVTLPKEATLHSWSDGYYYEDNRNPEVMWDAPQRLNTSYTDTGYEISAAGFTSLAAALEGWKGSPGHNAVIANLNEWSGYDWSAIGVGIEYNNTGGPYGGRIFHVWFGDAPDPGGAPKIRGTAAAEVFDGTAWGDDICGGAGNDVLRGFGGTDILRGGDGADTISGGDGNDVIYGGATVADLRDVIYGGDGDDRIDGGYGNDLLYGGAGADVIAGGFGADTVVGNEGADVLTGGALGDMLVGGDGFDFLNGGFGSDRLNGGAGPDRFFHLGVFDHGSDWVQDYSSAEGDRLVWGRGEAAGAARFQVNYADTPRAGAAGVSEAFVIDKATGQILWALVDGADETIRVQVGTDVFEIA